MGLSALFIFRLIFFKLHWAGQRAPWNITFLLWNAFNSLPISTLCISGWQGALLAGIPVCPPIGARCKKSGFLLHSPQLIGLHHMTKKEVALFWLRSREQCPLFSPSSEVSPVWIMLLDTGQNPSSNPTSGSKTYTQTIVQTVHAETTPTCSHSSLVPHPHSHIFSYPHLSFSVFWSVF